MVYKMNLVPISHDINSIVFTSSLWCRAKTKTFTCSPVVFNLCKRKKKAYVRLLFVNFCRRYNHYYRNMSTNPNQITI